MLSLEEEEEGDTNKSLINWFNELLLKNGITPTHFEHNAFVLEYIQKLKFLSERQNELLSTEEGKLNDHINYLQRQINVKKSIISELVIEPDEEEVELLELLTCMFSMTDCERPSIPSFIDKLSLLSNGVSNLGSQLERSEKFKEHCLELNSQITGMTEKLQLALKEFEGWGRRDCELGINELVNATETIGIKKAEYEERLEKLHREEVSSGLIAPGESVGASEKLDLIMEKRKQLRDIEIALDPYNKLPPDFSLASLELEKSRINLEQLIEQRDFLLKRLDH